MADPEVLRQRLLVIFKVEAREHAAALSSRLLQLEKAPASERVKLIEIVFREAHSLKGAARAVNFGAMESVCQALESVFSQLKRETLPVSTELLDVLLAAVRVLEQLLSALERGETGSSVPTAPILTALRGSLVSDREESSAATQVFAERSAGLLAGAAAFEPGVSPAPPPASAPGESLAMVSSARGPSHIDMVRVPALRLDCVRLHAEELFAERHGLVEHADELQRLYASVTNFRKDWRKGLSELKTRARERPGHAAIAGGGPGLSTFIENGSVFLEDIERRTELLGRSARRNQRNISTRAEQLLDNSLELLMLPCSWLLDGLAHSVRDLARDQRKEVSLAIQGGAIEVDRRILTELRDPLLHALRNAVDHGIELPAERISRGKPPGGTISVQIEQVQGNRIEIRIADDGRGVDQEKVLAAALRLGLVKPEAAAELEPSLVLNLVFQSDLSTSPVITELSGRGLGLAIFREKIEGLGGTISITSRANSGATLSMILPVSIATFRGVIVRVQDRMFVLPTASVQRVIGVRREQIGSIENREAVEIEGRRVALVELGHALGMPSRSAARPEGARLPLVVLQVGAVCIAFAVDEIVGERDSLAKSLGPHLRGLVGVLGASLLGTGKLALILDPRELVRRATELEPSAMAPLAASLARVAPPKSSILVAEDSITSRTLLKSILESAGYTVMTAVDGMDAFEKLRSGNFDLLVSDVDMPRLNGLGLTQRVRADKKLADLPVVLVTSLESRDDRERGIDVGADAYLVKQSFDQSNLLAAIERLL